MARELNIEEEVFEIIRKNIPSLGNRKIPTNKTFEKLGATEDQVVQITNDINKKFNCDAHANIHSLVSMVIDSIETSIGD